MKAKVHEDGTVEAIPERSEEVQLAALANCLFRAVMKGTVGLRVLAEEPAIAALGDGAYSRYAIEKAEELEKLYEHGLQEAALVALLGGDHGTFGKA